MANVGCTGTSAAARRPADPSFLDLPEVLADVSGNGTAVVNVHLAIPEADSEEYEAALHAQFVARRRIGQRDSAGMVLILSAQRTRLSVLLARSPHGAPEQLHRGDGLRRAAL